MRLPICAAIVVILSGSAAVAAPITFSGSGTSSASGATLAASVTFSVTANNLVVTLSNTSTADVLMQPDVLTAVFFNVSGSVLNLNAMAGSAVVPNGSQVLFGGTDPGGVVGGEYGYAEGISGALSSGTGGLISYNYGLSAVGFGVFGQPSFPGSNLNGQVSIDGLNYGLTSAGDNPATGQGMVTGGVPLVKNTVVFTMAGLPANFDPSTRITGAFFQYGTALVPTDPGFQGTPTPGSVIVLGFGGLLMTRRRR
jgi:hypothetical protein